MKPFLSQHRSILRRNLCLAIVLLCGSVALVSCKKDKKSDTGDSTPYDGPYDVYVAGSVGGQHFGQTTGIIWKNGDSLTAIKEKIADSSVNLTCIYVDDANNIYLTGSTGDFKTPTACYWINGIKYNIPGVPIPSLGRYIYKAGDGTLYVVGGTIRLGAGYDYGWIWDSKSGKLNKLPGYYSFDFGLSGSGFYIGLIVDVLSERHTYYSVSGKKEISAPSDALSLLYGNDTLRSKGGNYYTQYKDDNEESNVIRVFANGVQVRELINSDTGTMTKDAAFLIDDHHFVATDVYVPKVSVIPYYWQDGTRMKLNCKTSLAYPTSIFVKRR